METVREQIPEVDTAIVGAGPIGVETAIALKRAGVEPILFEARQVGDAISRWPPNTHFYSTPEHVALAGIPVHNVNQQPLSGEQYLAYLRMLVEHFDLNLHNYEPVESIATRQSGFLVTTRSQRGEHRYRCQRVVLATGGMASPRLLQIPGEDLPHVTHYFPGPHVYFRRRLLVVGGKNSALESALRSWRGGARVTISYRRDDFDYDVVKPHLADDIRTRLRKNEIDFLPCTVPVAVTPARVVLAQTGEDLRASSHTFTLDVDNVLLATGFVADMSLFARTGIKLDGEAQAPAFNPTTMETNVPGIFVAGTAVGGTQRRFKHFISTSHDHVAKIVKAITGTAPTKLGTVNARNDSVTWEEVKAN